MSQQQVTLGIMATEEDWHCEPCGVSECVTQHWERSDGIKFHREFCMVLAMFSNGKFVKVHPTNEPPTSWDQAKRWVDDRYPLNVLPEDHQCE